MTILLSGRWQENFIKPLRYARPLYERGQTRSARFFSIIIFSYKPSSVFSNSFKLACFSEVSFILELANPNQISNKL